jgi:hypothetical protein
MAAPFAAPAGAARDLLEVVAQLQQIAKTSNFTMD